MRKILLILSILLSVSAMAQDVILKQNGDEIQCKLIEVGTENIKYKKWSNLNGPTFVEERNDVFMIKYENGEKDVFGMKKTKQNHSLPITGTSMPNLAYDNKSVSGLSSGGVVIPVVDAQTIMGDNWKEFEKFNQQRKKGKHLLVTGIILKSAATPVSVLAIIYGYIPLYITASGLQSASTPFIATGIVNLVKGQRNCKRLVKQHDSSTIGFNPEFDFGVGVNAMTFRMNF